MGKKKQKKKQQKAERAAKAQQAAAAQAASEHPSPLHRVGQILLDQARSPVGRQWIATGLVAAVAALSRDSKPDSDAMPTMAAGPAMDHGGADKDPAPSPRPDAAALVGLAFSSLDHFIQRKAPTDKS